MSAYHDMPGREPWRKPVGKAKIVANTADGLVIEIPSGGRYVIGHLAVDAWHTTPAPLCQAPCCKRARDVGEKVGMVVRDGKGGG